MKFIDRAISAILSVGSLTFTILVVAEYPALCWSQRSINSSIEDCLNEAKNALTQAELQDVAKGEDGVSGDTQTTSVALVCNSAGTQTVLTIMTAGQDSIDAQTLQNSLSKHFAAQ